MDAICSFIKRFRASWGTQFVGRYDKVIASLLILMLVVVSTIDVVVDWLNYEDLNAEDWRYSLLVGLPRRRSLHALFFFNVVGSITFVLELINSVSLMTNGGHTRVEVEVEQIFVLLVEEIPLAAINLSIVVCRNDFLTYKQMLAGLFGMLSCSCRMYVYGWIKEKLFKFDRNMVSWTIKIATYVSASTLVFIYFIVQCFTLTRAGHSEGLWWTGGGSGSDGKEGGMTTGVSIVLFSPQSIATLEQFGPLNGSINSALAKQSLAWDKPWLVRDISEVINAGENGLTAYYDCDQFALESPVECAGITRLLVKFVYAQQSWDAHQPYGQLRYNVATGSRRRSHGNATLTVSRCSELRTRLADSWKPLLLTVFVTKANDEAKEQLVTARQPWTKCCRPIDLYYDADIPVCWRAQADEIRSLTR